MLQKSNFSAFHCNIQSNEINKAKEKRVQDAFILSLHESILLHNHIPLQLHLWWYLSRVVLIKIESLFEDNNRLSLRGFLSLASSIFQATVESFSLRTELKDPHCQCVQGDACRPKSSILVSYILHPTWLVTNFKIILLELFSPIAFKLPHLQKAQLMSSSLINALPSHPVSSGGWSCLGRFAVVPYSFLCQIRAGTRHCERFKASSQICSWCVPCDSWSSWCWLFTKILQQTSEIYL